MSVTVPENETKYVEVLEELQPVRNLCIIKLDPDPSPVISLKKYRSYIRKASVMAVGPGRFVGNTFVPVCVNVGDRVIVGPYAGCEAFIEDTEFLFVKDTEIIAVIEE